MKRFHVHVGVEDLDAGIRFYSALFGAAPTVRKRDYAKWMVEDPRINFAISQGDGRRNGINHLGLQVDSAEELESLRAQAEAADLAATAQKGVTCCYAKSDKYWYTDPAGVPWETYHSLGQVEYFRGDHDDVARTGSGCCASGATPAKDGRPSAACCA